MRRLSFKDGEEACEFCGNVEYDISETIIACTRCRATYGRANGVWVVDSQQGKVISPLLTRTQPFNSRETVNTDINNDGNLEDV
jgi:hypothetical protein